ncbi:MAG: hypothetical protein K1X28_10715 [Parachlamydiales bacterium]|nr:hypothetical protein [Parachlamydiales bacterium]
MEFAKRVGRDGRLPTFHRSESQGRLKHRTVERGRKRDLNQTGPIPLPPAKSAKKLNATIEFEPRSRSSSMPHTKKVKKASQNILGKSNEPVAIDGGTRKKRPVSDLNATGPLMLPPAKAPKIEPSVIKKVRSASAPPLKKAKNSSQRILSKEMQKRLDRTGSDLPIGISGGRKKQLEITIGGAVGRQPWLADPCISPKDEQKEPEEDELSKIFKRVLPELRKFTAAENPKPTDLLRMLEPLLQASKTS